MTTIAIDSSNGQEITPEQATKVEAPKTAKPSAVREAEKQQEPLSGATSVFKSADEHHAAMTPMNVQSYGGKFNQRVVMANIKRLAPVYATAVLLEVPSDEVAEYVEFTANVAHSTVQHLVHAGLTNDHSSVHAACAEVASNLLAEQIRLNWVDKVSFTDENIAKHGKTLASSIEKVGHTLYGQQEQQDWKHSVKADTIGATSVLVSSAVLVALAGSKMTLPNSSVRELADLIGEVSVKTVKDSFQLKEDEKLGDEHLIYLQSITNALSMVAKNAISNYVTFKHAKNRILTVWDMVTTSVHTTLSESFKPKNKVAEVSQLAKNTPIQPTRAVRAKRSTAILKEVSLDKESQVESTIKLETKEPERVKSEDDVIVTDLVTQVLKGEITVIGEPDVVLVPDHIDDLKSDSLDDINNLMVETVVDVVLELEAKAEDVNTPILETPKVEIVVTETRAMPSVLERHAANRALKKGNQIATPIKATDTDFAIALPLKGATSERFKTNKVETLDSEYAVGSLNEVFPKKVDETVVSDVTLSPESEDTKNVVETIVNEQKNEIISETPVEVGNPAKRKIVRRGI